MTNRALIQIETQYSKIFLIPEYSYGMMSKLGIMLVHEIQTPVCESTATDPRTYKSLDHIMKWLDEQGGMEFIEKPSVFQNYWYHLYVKPDRKGFDIKYAERDFHWKRKNDDQWEEEPNSALNKRLLTSTPFLVID